MNGVTNVCRHWQAPHKQVLQVDKIVCGKAQRWESSGGGEAWSPRAPLALALELWEDGPEPPRAVAMPFTRESTGRWQWGAGQTNSFPSYLLYYRTRNGVFKLGHRVIINYF